VTEIEDFPQARLAFVAAHHARFDFHMRGLETERAAISPQDFVHFFLENREHLRVRDYGVLDYLRQAAAEFTIGERPQQLRISEHQLGG